MAKVGKDKPELDPFGAGNKAFGALDEALGALDEKPRAIETARPAKPSPPAPLARKKAESGGVAKKRAASKPADFPGPKRARRFLATDDEMASWQRAAMRLGAATGARIDFSKMTRALWEIYLRHEEDIVRNIPEDGKWQRPSNADTVGLAELDEQLADLLNEGLMVASRRPKNARRSGE